MSALTSLLVRDQVVPVRKIEEAIQRQVIAGGDLETILLEMDVVPEDVLSAYRSATFGLLPATRDEVMKAPRDVTKHVPREIAERHRICPLAIDGRTLIVAVASPLKTNDEHQLGFLLGKDLVFRIVTEVRIAAALGHHYGSDVPPRFRRLADKLRAREAGVVPYVAPPAPVGPEPMAGAGKSLPPLPPTSFNWDESEDDDVRSGERALPSREEVMSGRAQKIPPAPAVPADSMPPPESPAVTMRKHRGPLSAKDAVELLKQAQNRDDILGVLFVFARQFFDYSALFSVGESFVEGRDAFGSGASPEKVQLIEISLEQRSAFRLARDTAAPQVTKLGLEDVDRDLLASLGREKSQPSLVMPFAIRNRPVLILYADRGGDSFNLGDIPELIGFAPRVAEAFERLILRRKRSAAPGALPSAKPSRPASIAPPRSVPPPPDRPSKAPRLDQPVSRQPSERPRSAPPRTVLLNALGVPRAAPPPPAPADAARAKAAKRETNKDRGDGDEGNEDGPPVTGTEPGASESIATSPDPPPATKASARPSAPPPRSPTVKIVGAPPDALLDTSSPGPKLTSSRPPRAPTVGRDAEPIPPAPKAPAWQRLRASAYASIADAPEDPEIEIGESAQDADLETESAQDADLEAESSAVDEGWANASDPPWSEDDRPTGPMPMPTPILGEAPRAATPPPPNPQAASIEEWPEMEVAPLSDPAAALGDVPLSDPPSEEPTRDTWEDDPRDIVTEPAPPMANDEWPEVSVGFDPRASASDFDEVEERRTVPERLPTSSEISQQPPSAATRPQSVRPKPRRKELVVSSSYSSRDASVDVVTAKPSKAPPVKTERQERVERIAQSLKPAPIVPVSNDPATPTRPAQSLPPQRESLSPQGRSRTASERRRDPRAEDDSSPKIERVSPAGLSKLTPVEVIVHPPSEKIETGDAPIKKKSVPEVPIDQPSVIVDMGDSIERLVGELCESGPDDEARVVDMLLRIGEATLPVLVQRFPGPLWVPRTHAVKRRARARDLSAVARAMVAFRERSVPYLASLIESRDEEARLYAVLIASETPHPDLVQPLVRRLLDGDEDVRSAATEVLKLHRSFGKILDEALKEIRSMARTLRPDVKPRILAVRALAELRDVKSINLLIELLRAPHEPLVQEARRALVLITRQDFGVAFKKWQGWEEKNGPRHRIEWLIDALTHNDEPIRAAAGEELKGLTQEYFGYQATLPKKEREIAQKKYQKWWDEHGHRKFMPVRG